MAMSKSNTGSGTPLVCQWTDMLHVLQSCFCGIVLGTDLNLIWRASWSTPYSSERGRGCFQHYKVANRQRSRLIATLLSRVLLENHRQLRSPPRVNSNDYDRRILEFYANRAKVAVYLRCKSSIGTTRIPDIAKKRYKPK